MVLQNRYKRAASARYNNTASAGPRPSAPASEPAARQSEGEQQEADTSSDQEARATYRRRGLQQLARYGEEEQAGEGDDEPTEEELAVRKQEADELEAFLQQQADREPPSLALAPSNAFDEDDVDNSFGHLRKIGSRKLGVALPPTRGVPSLSQDSDGNTSERLRSARALKARLQAPRRSDDEQLASREAACDVDELLSLHTVLARPARASAAPVRPRSQFSLRPSLDLDI